MKHYRVRIQVEEQVDDHPFQDMPAFGYISESSPLIAAVLDLFKVLKGVAFYWRMK